DQRRGDVRHVHRDEERGHAARPLLEQGAGVLLEGLEPAGPRPYDGADALQVDLAPVAREARVRHRLLRRAERELREQVVAADLLLVEEPRRLEPLHLARELHRALHRVEPRDRPGTRAARDQALPGAVHVGTQRRHEPEARDRDPSRHALISPSSREGTAAPVPPSAASWLPRPECRCRIPSRRPLPAPPCRGCAPRSSMKLASEVSLSRSTPSSSTMMSLTFSSSCFMSIAMGALNGVWENDHSTIPPSTTST